MRAAPERAASGCPSPERRLTAGAAHLGAIRPSTAHPDAVHPGAAHPGVAGPAVARPAGAAPGTEVPGLAGPVSPGPVPLGSPAGSLLPGNADETTVKLAPPAPVRRHPRPSPRPRPLGAPRALGVVEGPASATTKAPAAHPGTHPAAHAPAAPRAAAAHSIRPLIPAPSPPVVVAESVDPLPHEPAPRDDGRHDGAQHANGHRDNGHHDNGRRQVVRDLPALRQAAFGTPLTPRPDPCRPGCRPPCSTPWPCPPPPRWSATTPSASSRSTPRCCGSPAAPTSTSTAACTVAACRSSSPAPTPTPGSSAPTVRWSASGWSAGTCPTATCRSSSSSSCSTPTPRRSTATPPAAGPPSWSGWRGSAPGVTSCPPERCTAASRCRRSTAAMGVEPDGSGGPVEGEQVALLVRALRSGTPTDHRAELALPGVRLSCRAEVELGPDGAPLRLTGVVRDITAQHEIEAQARHAARRFADLAALVPTGIAIVDPDGHIREANPALCALLDVAPEQLRGLPAAALCRRARRRRDDRAGRPAQPAAGLAAARAARRRAPLPGRGRPAPARRRHHRLVRAGRVGHHARRRRLALAAGLHRHRGEAAGRRAAAQRRDGRRADPAAQPGRDACSCSTGCWRVPVASASPWSAATSTTSSASTARSATTRATSCWSPSPAGCSASCRWAARPRGCRRRVRRGRG